MLPLLLKSPQIQRIQGWFKRGETLVFESLWNSPKAALAALAQEATGKHILVLSGGAKEEQTLFHDFPCFSKNSVIDYPAWETLPQEGIPPSPDIVGERYQVLNTIQTSKEPLIILASLQACLQKLIAPKEFESLHMTLEVGATVPFQRLIDDLEFMQYKKCSIVSDKGEYAVRGGIIDLFPVSSPDPFRIEFWGDEIESIRIFDPIGQKSIRQTSKLALPPAQEMPFLELSTQLFTLLDFLGPNTIVAFDDLLTLEDRYTSLLKLAKTPSPMLASLNELLDQIDPLQKLYFSPNPLEELTQPKTMRKEEQFTRLQFEMFQRELTAWRTSSPFITVSEILDPSADESLSGDEIIAHLSDLEPSMHLHLLTTTQSEEKALHKKLSETHPSLPCQLENHQNYLTSGFALTDSPHLLLPNAELTRRYKIRRQKHRSTYHTPPAEAFEIQPGESIVHLNHGIGKYLGMETKPSKTGAPIECFHIEYADGSKLFVPIEQAHLLTKYIGASEKPPKLHKLGNNRWKKARDQTQQAIMGYAADLLDLYAKRKMIKRASYPNDSADMRSFEEEFPFDETEDQLLAITAIKKELQGEQAIDRLICGDVGYGKTEVAMRAAFKTVIDGGKQVALLVPTTVLALQHYENFTERMASFPVNIRLLSRFQKAKEKREAVEGVANGSVDILIGTHRILSQDISFKDLGLIIIDEEQRFGVKAKEKLKSFKTNVDCLALSATPIPRTLYMSLVGARDLSVINTPPQDRLPIKSTIIDPNEKVIQNALIRELAREGQAYVIHNRVETIYGYATKIKKLVPDATVAVAHGQMDAVEVDKVFHAFKQGEVDILVATTIVENGIDIPNANTIIIDRADMFGMAELYQLRGRTGRWNRRAYAFFLVPNLHRLPEITKMRLYSLAQTSGYGGGMKVAMRDLEIRGAGDILGTDQSGHVSAIGFHLYCKLLKKTILALQGKGKPATHECKLDHSFDARLPGEYVNEISLRMEICQRIGESISVEEIEEIWKEIIDRFGPPPEEAARLYHLAKIRQFASSAGVISLKIEPSSLTLSWAKGRGPALQKVTLPSTPSLEEWETTILSFIINE